MSFEFNDAQRILRLTMDGIATVDWSRNGDARDFAIGDSSLGFETSFRRQPGLNANAPFSVPFPIYRRWTTLVTLPHNGDGFSLLSGQPVNEDLAGRHYERSSKIDKGVAVMVASERTTTSEISASEAQGAEMALRQLSDYDVTVRSPAARRVVVGVAQAADTTPITADDFERHGTALMQRRDFKGAIAAFDHAVVLAPRDAKGLYNRGAARFENGDLDAALADFDKALALRPDDALAHLARGQLMLQKGNLAAGRDDFAVAARLSSNDPAILRRESTIYDSARLYEDAVSALDMLISAAVTPQLLNDRCWIRAEEGERLQDALADCDAALKTLPTDAGFLDSRAFVLLRLGRFSEAVAAYDQALAVNPTLAGSFYGRGIAKTRLKGLQAGAEDLAAARALSSQVETQFARLGVTP